MHDVMLHSHFCTENRRWPWTPRSAGSFFSGGENIPWCDRDVIAGCEREVAEAATEEHEKQSIMRLSWALVHSRNQDDVLRGIGMLQGTLRRPPALNGPTTSPLQAREKLYLLAVGHYRNGDYPRSRQFLDQCLEIQPDCRQALALKKIVEDKIAKGEQTIIDADGVIGIGIATTVIGVLIGIAAAVARKN
ncbi:mitochondrial fission 1 protein A-like [Panicum virgatum]|uniref:mitochondrial fission 1 protein A-like n=1 Tax=Panicum virgatum TaxID=38727 RepID=UPI0019D69C1C|nr:mitochondrial fission 1 protein A-like [Panicum virgatum]